MPCAEPNQRHLNKRLCPYIAQCRSLLESSVRQNGQIGIDAERSNRLIGTGFGWTTAKGNRYRPASEGHWNESVMAECREAVSLFDLLHRPVFSFLDNSSCHCWRRGLLCQLPSHKSTLFDIEVITNRQLVLVANTFPLDLSGYCSLNKEPSLGINFSSNP